MRPRPLLLLDCDGSLFADEDELALRCFGDVVSTRHPERTVRGTVRDLGGDPDVWLQRGLELYFDKFDERTADGWRLYDGVESTLRRLALDGYRLALVSSRRPEAIVRFRLERLGIGGYFARGTGAFGCETDGRDDLLRLALWRSACTPRRAVLVTDATCDVSGRELGLTAIAIRWLTELPALLSERPAA
jgi:phosphoglycolate phosphatase-like HAD superfamily hydrolase